MPTVHRIGAHKIQLFAGDHVPPHFHVWGPGCCSYLVELETLNVFRGEPCPIHGDVIAWAAANRDLLWKMWSELNERE